MMTYIWLYAGQHVGQHGVQQYEHHNRPANHRTSCPCDVIIVLGYYRRARWCCRGGRCRTICTPCVQCRLTWGKHNGTTSATLAMYHLTRQSAGNTYYDVTWRECFCRWRCFCCCCFLLFLFLFFVVVIRDALIMALAGRLSADTD